jgi:hypothetical protein
LPNGRLASGGSPRIAWTGHRSELFAQPDEARHLVFKLTGDLLDELGPVLVVLSGGQRGVDLWVASAARDRGLGLELFLPAPPELLSADWPPHAAAALSSAVQYAREVSIFGQSASSPRGYEARSRALVEQCDLLLAVWTGLEQGGTFFTISEARANKKPIREYRLEPSDYRPAPGERGI